MAADALDDHSLFLIHSLLLKWLLAAVKVEGPETWQAEAHSNVHSCSIAGIKENLGSFHHALLTVTDILGFAIAHRARSGVLSSLVLTPNANKKCLLGLGNASTAATLSTENSEFDTIILITSQEHVLLVANSNTALLTTFTVSADCFHEGGMLIAHDFLGAASLLRLIKLISCELELWWGGPGSAVMTVDAGVLVDVSQSPIVGVWIEEVLNLMNVSIPRHLLKIFIEFK